MFGKVRPEKYDLKTRKNWQNNSKNRRKKGTIWMATFRYFALDQLIVGKYLDLGILGADR
ncbi:hypothetical protein CH352_09045 [Leptospira hartskeerlii]|uniref:Uncharacterized protein n=1 Tax=Leptospira hartskeerlii TaxID=2023177 RepID=A0A2M9XHT5_9LEPT|nr:hypothetical protein CH357_01310 [Leptospira hartskeerlii]PJZ33881.1 hypothetical protein CH352_09045 [Leptospira hartskeerlii]